MISVLDSLNIILYPYLMKHFSLIVSLFLFSCSGGNPGSRLNEETFLAVYVDILEESERFRMRKADSSAVFSIEEILQKHQVAAEDLRTTIDEYQADVFLWKEFYGRVTKRLEERMKETLE
jgi:hypothetical protein